MPYEIYVDGNKVWDSGDLDATHVIDLSVSTPRGEAARVRVPAEETRLDITIHRRSIELRPLDMMDAIKARGNDGVVDAIAEQFGGVRDKDLDAPEGDVKTPSIEEHLATQGMDLEGNRIEPTAPEEEPAEDEPEPSFS